MKGSIGKAITTQYWEKKDKIGARMSSKNMKNTKSKLNKGIQLWMRQ